MTSIPGSGHVVPSGFNSRFTADFGGQFLPSGSYYLVWNASTVPLSTQVAIFWIQDGPMTAGGGVPDNALLWNPNGGWSFPNNIQEVGGGGHGVNFILYGTTPCYPNCDGSTAVPTLNIGDFVCFMSRFAAGDSYANCDGSTAPPVLNVNDFICFQTRFAAGCS